MFLDCANPTRRILIAVILIATMYSVIRELKVQHELRRLASATTQQASGMAILQTQLQAQLAHRSDTATRLASDSVAMEDGNVQIETPSPQNTTLVQAFADVLDTFKSGGLLCIAVGPKETSTADQRTDRAIHQITLSGEFQHMLDALKLIHVQQPRVTIAELTMRRPQPTEPCIWELVISFSEMPL